MPTTATAAMISLSLPLEQHRLPRAAFCLIGV